MLHKVTRIVGSQSHVKRINKHRGQNVECLIVKHDGIYSDLQTLKGLCRQVTNDLHYDYF
jgi:hypothetical protein